LGPARRPDASVACAQHRDRPGIVISAEAAAAMARQGRYQEVGVNLRVKEVKISYSERVRSLPQPRRR